MKKFSVLLFNQNNKHEFQRFYKDQHDELQKFYIKVIKDNAASITLTKETFEIVRILPNKKFKNYSEINKFLATIVVGKILEYHNYQRQKLD
ncbi:MAG: hypothetical protein ABI675_15045 [Chitinophagaceae bacterium]